MLLRHVSLVVLGAWNRAILMPDWIAAHATETEEKIQVHFPLGAAQVPVYQYEHIAFKVEMNRLTVFPLRWEDECLKKAEEATARICAKLGYTPTYGVGFNFNFVDSNPDSEKLKAFTVEDNTVTGFSGYENDQTQITKKLLFDESSISISQTLVPTDGNVEINLNFETRFNNAADIGEFLNLRQFQNAKTETLEFFHSQFNVNEAELEIEISPLGDV